jgi:hypothetical protein
MAGGHHQTLNAQGKFSYGVDRPPQGGSKLCPKTHPHQGHVGGVLTPLRQVEEHYGQISFNSLRYTTLPPV